MNWHAIPWTSHAATTVVVEDESSIGGYCVIAECDTEENARRIAAVPELLTIAERLVRDGLSTSLVKEASAAIAKATGGAA